ncbi:PREDICTED: protein disulfide-isomerase TMX3 [Drosophila arizonae]|uniref:Protein disulfide-isomerase TMX3 n=1 Tax=Drosophila arizonae TaxID=7263 RepID=A0ABM1P9K9_DROAR|nr:PREDICTED: protein disulfide-isomerase TMX3 [Drosophila arizonae]XP_017863896.1 PREDICTED: protein disulfide-isomerase TMX3 [Drosophila arizonae]
MHQSIWGWSLPLLFLLILGTPAISSRVLELSDRFIDVRHEGQWLVMFYAPWCGYCKKTEPIFALVAQALHATNVRVGRLDCTKYPAAAREFKVRGYPTIMFIKGNMEFNYNGDRSKDELVDYALRMSGPPVQLVTRTDSVDMLKGSHTIFFMFVGPQQGVVWDTYYAAAEGYQEHGFFYATSEEIAAQHFDFEKLPAVIVYKEEQHHFYPHGHVAHEMDPNDVNETIFQWVNVERFTLFPKVTRFNIHQLLKTKKFLVLAVVQEDKLSQIATHELEFRDMVEGVIRKHRPRYHDKFQFGWIGDPSIAHSIILDQLPTPHLIALNSTTQHHYIPDDDPLQMTPQALHLFLESISNESATAYGGDTYFVRVNRALFELKRSLREMWRGNPVLMTVIFGLPLGFLSLIIYSIFCGDCLVTEEEQEEDHEKKE